MINIDDIKRKSIKIVDTDLSFINGKYIRDFRIRMKMSQSVLADYLGVSKKAIEKWEQGVNKVNKTVARLIYIFEKDHNTLNYIKEITFNNQLITFGDDSILYDVINYEKNIITNVDVYNFSEYNIGGEYNVY